MMNPRTELRAQREERKKEKDYFQKRSPLFFLILIVRIIIDVLFHALIVIAS